MSFVSDGLGVLGEETGGLLRLVSAKLLFKGFLSFLLSNFLWGMIIGVFLSFLVMDSNSSCFSDVFTGNLLSDSLPVIIKLGIAPIINQPHLLLTLILRYLLVQVP